MAARRKGKAPGTPKQIKAAKIRNEERAAALAERDADVANAWREDPEFGNALHLAVMLGDIRSLKQYLCSEKPLTRRNRRELVGYIDLLAERIVSHMRRRGRPRRYSDIVEHPAERAERNAACLVASAKKAWCRQHGKERVPSADVNKMVRNACEEAARTFEVSVEAVKTANVRRALKTGRFTTRY